jgi:hypothetical protein
MISKDTLKKIKLVVFDLDGTLLNDEGEIGQTSISLIKELRKFGVSFSFASGRLHSAITRYAEDLNIKTPLISLDGTMLKSFPDGEVLFESYVREKHVRKALLYADKYLLKIALCHADAIYFTEDNSIVPDLIDKFGARFEQVNSYSNYCNKTLEVVLISDYKDNLKFVNERLNFPYTLGLETNYYKSHSNEGIYYLELRKKGSTKATGLIRLMKYLKINFKETVVVGDWYNDKSMFDTKAIKIALANAVAEIKYSADLVTTKSNNEDGVAEFLEMILKAKNHSGK